MQGRIKQMINGKDQEIITINKTGNSILNNAKYSADNTDEWYTTFVARSFDFGRKKIAAAMRCNLPISHIVRLILCFSTSVISLAVAVTIRMPLSLIPSSSASSCRPPGGFLRIAVREEKLIYRNMIPGYKVIEYL